MTHYPIASLSEDEKIVLAYYTYAYKEHRITSFDQFKSRFLSKDFNSETIIKSLYNKGLIQKLYRDYDITPAYYLETLCMMAEEHPECIEWLKKCKEPRPKYFVGGDIPDFRDYFLRHYNETLRNLIPNFPYIEEILVCPAIFKGKPRGFVLHLLHNDFDTMVAAYLRKMMKENNSDDYDNLKCLLKERKDSCVVSPDVKYQDELFQYYLTGKYNSKTERDDNPYSLIMKGVRLNMTGEYKSSSNAFKAALLLLNKGRSIKNIFFDPLNNYFYIKSLGLENTPESKKRLEQLLKKQDIIGLSEQAPNKLLATFFIEHECSQYLINETMRASNNSPLQQFLTAIVFKCLKYQGAPQLTQKPVLRVLQAEMIDLFDLSEEEKSALRADVGSSTLNRSLVTKEQWEYALDELIANELCENEKIQNVGQQERIIYIVNPNHYYLRPMSQRVLKSGKWSTPKYVSEYSFAEGKVPGMTEQDIMVAGHFNSYSFNNRLADTLQCLIHSDVVFEERRGELIPITVNEEKLNVVIERKPQSFKITSNVTEEELRGVPNEGGAIDHWTSQFSVSIIHLTKKEKEVLTRLLKINTLPLKAEPRLKQMVEILGKKIDIISDISTENNQLEKVDADRHLCLQLMPLNAQFRLDIYAKPHPNGKVYCRPGMGSSLVVTEADGQRQQVVRDLLNEKRQYQELMQCIDSLGCENDISQFNYLLSLENTLDFIAWVRQHSNHFYIEWPEGEKLKLKQPVQAKDFTISFSPKQNWFEMEGEVRIGEEEIMQLDMFLALLKESNSRYVRLSDGEYILLSSELQKQLKRIEALSHHDRKQLMLPSASLSMLDELFNTEIDIQRDEKMEQLRQRIKESQELSFDAPKLLKVTLRDYQLTGYQWISKMNHWGAGVCLADDMGLGKTIQTIACLLNKAHEGVSLVVAPTSVIFNWRHELNQFAPSLNVIALNTVADREKSVKEAAANDIILCTYGLLSNEIEHLKAKKWAMICLDEAHTIKNRDTKMSMAAMQLESPNRLILTGTPLQNNLSELWNLFQFINPGLLGSYEQFREKYISPIESNNDFDRRNQLKQLIRSFMLRRTKSEVAEELPDKEDIKITVALSDDELAAYESLRRQAETMLKKVGKVDVNTLAIITKLRQAACSIALVEKKWDLPNSKINTLLKIIEELEDNGHKALIFSQFTSFFGIIRKVLDEKGKKYLYLDGSTPLTQRERLVKAFQTDDTLLFLISLKAGGLGLNLTAADYVIHLDPWWNPAIEQQATDRSHRIGQTNKVTVYHLIAENTIEEKILRLHKTKRDLTDAILEGTNLSHKLTIDELMELLR